MKDRNGTKRKSALWQHHVLHAVADGCFLSMECESETEAVSCDDSSASGALCVSPMCGLRRSRENARSGTHKL